MSADNHLPPDLATPVAETARPGRIEPLSDRTGRLPLSFAQQRLWFLAQLAGASEAYHMPQALELTGELDRAALSRALDALVARHEALRTRFGSDGGEGYCLIDPPEVGFALRVQDLTDRPGALAQVQRDEAAQPFDLSTGPLARGRLLVLAPDRHVLLLTLHHIVSDGWSMGVLTAELGALYATFHDGTDDPLPPLDDPVRRLRGLAARRVGGRPAGRAGRVLAADAGRRAGVAGAAHRPAPAAGAGPPRRGAPARASTPG